MKDYLVLERVPAFVNPALPDAPSIELKKGETIKLEDETARILLKHHVIQNISAPAISLPPQATEEKNPNKWICLNCENAYEKAQPICFCGRKFTIIPIELWEKAKKETEHQPESIIARVANILKSQVKQDAYYTFQFNDGKTFTLTADELVTPRAFLKTYIALYDQKPAVNYKNWEEFINKLLVKTIEHTEGFDDEQNTEDLLTSAIVHLKFYNKLDEHLLEDWGRAYLDKKQKTLYVRSETLRKILDAEKIKLSLRELHELLKPYLKEKSKQMRVGKERCHFWLFNTEKLEIDDREGVTPGDESENNAE